jgi:ABC-type microcin C transport system permease subunit YejB
MTYGLIENSDTSQKYIGYDLQPVERKTKILNSMGLESTGHYYIDNHIQGKTMFEFDNIKNKLYLKQLQTLGRQDIIDAYFKTHKIIILQYRNLPHAIEIHDNKYVKSTLRLSEKIPIYQDSFGA